MRTRKMFLSDSCRAMCALAGGQLIAACGDAALFSAVDAYTKPARHWKRLQGNAVRCQLCPNQCVLSPGSIGICRVRKNIEGTLHTLVYGRLAAMHVDPIEKKPLFHFLPSSKAYSVATAGCNIACKFCQNWQIAQSSPDDIEAARITPAQLSTRAAHNACRVVAFTYNEPTVQFEYIVDAVNSTRARGLRSVVISNGYINHAPGTELVKSLDGIKIDLKAFNDSFYAGICSGTLRPVLDTLVRIKSIGKWLEIVVLVIPTLNDSPSEIREMTKWVRANLSADVPIHFTRFHAMYLIKNLPPTPVATLERCRTIAREAGIRYAYVGNVQGHRWENTYCHSCERMVIKRSGFYHVENLLRNGTCPHCGVRIPGVWS